MALVSSDSGSKKATAVCLRVSTSGFYCLFFFLAQLNMINPDDDDDDEFSANKVINLDSSDDDINDISLQTTKKRKHNESDDGRVQINLDKTLIPKSKDKTIGLAFSGEKSELEALGIVSYQHSVYEEKFVDQIEKNVDEFSEKQHSQNDVDDNSDEKQSIVELSEQDECSQEDASTSGIEPLDDDDDEFTPDDGPSYVDDLNDYFDDDVDRFLEAPDNCNIEISRKKCEKIDDSKAIDNVRRNRIRDDGDITIYRERIAAYETSRLQSSDESSNDNDEELHRINEDFSIPKRVWERLYEYQHDAVKWMCDLHIKLCGGILGDEMGLGKTVEVISFLISLSFSKSYEVSECYKYLGPVLLVCPATVMYQWVNEFHKWWPPFRVAVLHQSGSYKGKSRTKLVNDIIQTNGILITSYKSLVCFQKYLVPKNWHYVILDEGHKIRNPIAQVTQCCKLVSLT